MKRFNIKRASVLALAVGMALSSAASAGFLYRHGHGSLSPAPGGGAGGGASLAWYDVTDASNWDSITGNPGGSPSAGNHFEGVWAGNQHTLVPNATLQAQPIHTVEVTVTQYDAPEYRWRIGGACSEDGYTFYSFTSGNQIIAGGSSGQPHTISFDIDTVSCTKLVQLTIYWDATDSGIASWDRNYIDQVRVEY